MFADRRSNEGQPDGRVGDHEQIQKLGKRPSTTMPTLAIPLQHQRSSAEDVQRPALTVRARSNSSVPTPTIGSSFSPATSIDRSLLRSNSSAERRSLPGNSLYTRGERSDSFTKLLMAKGSRLIQRASNKGNLTPLTPLPDWIEEAHKHNQEMLNKSGSRHSRVRSAGMEGVANLPISEPFNFVHRTHITSKEVRDRNRVDDLVGDFSNLPAVQSRSDQLKYMKADEIQRGTYFSNASGSENSSPVTPQNEFGSPKSPKRQRWQEEDGVYNTLPVIASPVWSLRPARSVDNLSQPSSRYQTAQTSPTSPLPPRSSSRNAAPDFFTFHQESPAELEPTSCDGELEQSEYAMEDDDDIGYDFLPHAVTTPDNSAHPLRAPLFTLIRTDLADVPEEDEMSEGRRSSVATSITRAPTPSSTLRHTKSFPSTQTQYAWSSTLSQTRDGGDESSLKLKSMQVDCSPSHLGEYVKDAPSPPHVSRHIPAKRDEEWEDVIDYCYQHEAEADCNFEWDRSPNYGNMPDVPAVTVDSPPKSGQGRTEQFDAAGVAGPRHPNFSRSSSVYTQSPLLFPLQTFVPELDPPSATSAESSFSIPEAMTPIDSSVPIRSNYVSITSSKDWSDLEIPPWLDNDGAIQEELYQQILTGGIVHGEHQFPFAVGRADGSTLDNSPRSSHSPISKSSSQESFWFGNAVRRTRNVSSIGSLPELVPSRVSRENSNVDQLSEQFPTLAVAEPPADATPQRRRNSPSLAKDVALKSMIAKAMVADDPPQMPDLPLPLRSALRSRAASVAESVEETRDVATVAPPRPLPTQVPTLARPRKRSSSAASIASQRGKRVSYSLFPAPPSPRAGRGV